MNMYLTRGVVGTAFSGYWIDRMFAVTVNTRLKCAFVFSS